MNQLLKLTTCLVIFIYALLIVVSPTIRLIPYIEPHDSQRIVQLLLLSIVLLDAIFTNSNSPPIKKKIGLSLFTLGVLAVASAWNSLEPRYAVIEITIFVGLCYLAIIVYRLYRWNKEIFVKLLIYAIMAGALLNLIAFYTGYLAAMFSGRGLEWPEPIAGFNNVRLFQQYQLWGLGLICLPLLAFDLSKKAKIWLQVALTLWWVLMFYAASRGATLGWIVALIVTAIVYKKLAWPFLRIQLISAISGFGAYLVLFKAIPSWIASAATSALASSAIVTSSIFRDTVSDRADLWKVAYVMIKNFPGLGVGPMHFYNYNSFGTHPHNSILQIASEFGLPATAIILWIVGYCAYNWYKRFNASKLQTEPKLNANLAIILFFTVVANGAYSMVEGVIVMPISQVLMFTTIGLMIGQYTSGSWYPSTAEPQRKFHVRPILAGITLVFLVLSVMPELERGLTSANRAMSPGERAFAMAPDTINPRIWMQQRRKENTK